MPKVLWDYQQETIDRIKMGWERGVTAGICHLFTGAGKTLIAQKLLEQLVDFTKQRAVFVVGARDLVEQTAAGFLVEQPAWAMHTLVKEGVTERSYPTMGIVMAQADNPNARLIIGSTQTLIDRTLKQTLQSNEYSPLSADDIDFTDTCVESDKLIISERFDRVLAEGGIPDIVIYDECHHAVANGSMAMVLRLWELCDIVGKPRTKIVGLTATPFREDEIGLHNIFEVIFISRSLVWAIQNGYLAPLRDPVRSLIITEGGNTDLRAVENWEEHVLAAYHEHGEERPFIATMPSVEQSINLAKFFCEQGIPIAHVDGTGVFLNGEDWHPNSIRKQVYRDFARGKYRGLTNFNVLNEGIDLPHVSLLLWGRPTENSVLLTQTIGRIVRKFEGNDAWPKKDESVIIDFTGKPLTILTTGTLFGAELNPFDLPPDVDASLEEEMNLAEGVDDLRDLLPAGLVQGQGNIYTVAKLITKQKGDFYHDERTNTMSLSLSETDSLFIVPPAWSIARRLEQAKEHLQLRMEEEHENLLPFLVQIETALELFSNFTLWHITGKQGSPKRHLKSDSWVASDGALDLLIAESILYAYQNVQVTDAFMRRDRKWKREKTEMTRSQYLMLKQLYSGSNVKIDMSMTKGDASRLITHLVSWPPIAKRIQEVHKSILPYLQE